MSLLRRVFTPSKRQHGDQGELHNDFGVGDRIEDAPSIRRNLSGLFQEHDHAVLPEDHGRDSPSLKTLNKRIPCRFRKKKPYSYDDTTQEIVFEPAPDESVFESAWSSDEEALDPTEPSSGASSNKSSVDDYVPSHQSTPEKVIHKPTATRSRDNHSSPISSSTIPPSSPLRNIKFMIESGVRSVSKDMRRKSRISIKVQPKRTDDSLTIDETTIKIFVLLLQPQRKIFELIQLIFSSMDGTTVGDLLRAIPNNATQPELAHQEYVGLTRPKKRARDFKDLSAPACATEGYLESAGIQTGEIMVALPLGYSHNRVVAMSKKILLNPRIQQLLEKTNPLAPRIRKSRRRSTPVCELPVMEKVVEEPEGEDDPVRRAMQFAAELAKTKSSQDGCTSMSDITASRPVDFMTPKARNTFTLGMRHSICSVPETAATEVSTGSNSPLSSGPGVLDAYLDATASPDRSFGGINGCLDDTSIDSSLCSSLQSYSSWSQSFDTSFRLRSTTPIPVVPTQSNAVNPYLKRNWVKSTLFKKSVVRVSIVYTVVMVIRYAMDPDGCTSIAEITRTQSLGFFGAIQVAVSLLALMNLQHFWLHGRWPFAFDIGVGCGDRRNSLSSLSGSQRW